MTAQPQQHDLPLCDLVMKGGATSGVVYPPVIAQLAEKYRFANIGGTSAGAIAASVTAAAEYGRQRGHLADFSQLNGLSTDISEPGKLLALFRATAPGHLLPLLDTLLPLVSDPTAATSEPVTADSGPIIPPLARQIAPELLDQLFPPKPAGSAPPDDKLVKNLRTVVSSLPLNHPTAYQIGNHAGGLAGVRMGQYLIYGAVILALLFAIPLLLVGITWLAAIVWVILSALLIGAAYLIGQRVGKTVADTSGTVVALADLARKLLIDVPENLYGICTGRQQPDSPDDQPGLTDWLNGWITRMSGPTTHGGPLTFNDLQETQVTLQMVTTNLSHSRPYVLPFDSDFILFFRRGDIERLFPTDVVEYMCQETHTYPGWVLDDLNTGRAAQDPDRFYMLPNSDDLPVVVGMRMSLSFPLLISAVRLYTVSGSCPQTQGIYRPRRGDLQENWFSDGGICSNFPIHFFDQWLPTHPTFGINLTGLPVEAFAPEYDRHPGSTAGAKGDPSTASIQPGYMSQIAPEAPMMPLPPANGAESFLRSALLGTKSSGADTELGTKPMPDPHARVLLPDAEQPLDPLWRPVESLTRFVWSMFDTAMNYRDTTQLMLPSYKERAVQIRLDGTREGGLNLNMERKTVEKLQLYGREAGVLLRDQFDFDKHRWVRFRVLMGELERQILSLETPLSAMSSGEPIYERLIQMAYDAGYPFGQIAQPSWVSAADTRVRALRALIGAWHEANEEDAENEGTSERRVDDLSRVLFALSESWRHANITPAESDTRTQAVMALIQSWQNDPLLPPRYVAREARFFKPIGSGLELRVTPDL